MWERTEIPEGQRYQNEKLLQQSSFLSIVVLCLRQIWKRTTDKQKIKTAAEFFPTPHEKNGKSSEALENDTRPSASKVFQYAFPISFSGVGLAWSCFSHYDQPLPATLRKGKCFVAGVGRNVMEKWDLGQRGFLPSSLLLTFSFSLAVGRWIKMKRKENG